MVKSRRAASSRQSVAKATVARRPSVLTSWRRAVIRAARSLRAVQGAAGRRSATPAQPARDIDEDCRGDPPDLVVLPGDLVIGARRTVPVDPLLFLIGRIEHEGRRRFEPLGDL